MEYYLVTGGAGFIGSNIVERLVKDGFKVRVVDNLSTGKFENIRKLIHKIDFICGDISDFKLAQKAVEGIDYVIHQAAIPSVPLSVDDPIGTNHSMVSATVSLFQAAVESKTVKRIVQAASSAAYGDNPVLPKREEMDPEPMSPYAVAKLTQEYYGRAFYHVHGLEVLSLRYFNVFGPKQDPNSFYSAVIPKFISIMQKGKQPTIYGDGLTSRDFVYIDNVVSANLKALKCPWPGKPETINIGTGESITLNQLVDSLNNIFGTEIKPKYEAQRVGDVKHSVADISKAQKILGYKVETNVYDGLTKLVDWFKEKDNE
ncbi:MAG: SDR family NAD(P)-dependent oxidoreductase [Clostridia bacterium]|nr:SDR family NAD(P)-dependent oxidoreductase [Clostridia bacterium]